MKREKKNKSALAKRLGVSRSSLYYKSRLFVRDMVLKEQIMSVIEEHPAYGHRRIAMELSRNKKQILRVMNKFSIRPLKSRLKKPNKREDSGRKPMPYKNWLDSICPIKPNIFWACDFTYMRFSGTFRYLATIIDVFTREIVGFSIGVFHNKELVIEALNDALSKHPPPKYLHSDQGSEYASWLHLKILKDYGIKPSMSPKGKPWKNGFQESFYSNFKLELGKTNSFESYGELIEAVYRQIHYYNHKRIHTALKMPPAKYAKIHSKGLDKLF